MSRVRITSRSLIKSAFSSDDETLKFVTQSRQWLKAGSAWVLIFSLSVVFDPIPIDKSSVLR